MEIEIRTCGPADAAALALVGQATFLETYATVLPAADILAHCQHEHGEARYAGWLGRPGYRFWAAEIAGLGGLVVKRLYLLSKFQGAGVGARLMGVATEAARTAGARRLWLGVYGENASAIAFYARQGFAQAGVRKFQVGANTYDDLVLARDL